MFLPECISFRGLGCQWLESWISLIGLNKNSRDVYLQMKFPVASLFAILGSIWPSLSISARGFFFIATTPFALHNSSSRWLYVSVATTHLREVMLNDAHWNSDRMSMNRKNSVSPWINNERGLIWVEIENIICERVSCFSAADDGRGRISDPLGLTKLLAKFFGAETVEGPLVAAWTSLTCQCLKKARVESRGKP